MELDHAQREQLLDWLVRDAAPAPRNYFLTRLGRLRPRALGAALFFALLAAGRPELALRLVRHAGALSDAELAPLLREELVSRQVRPCRGTTVPHPTGRTLCQAGHGSGPPLRFSLHGWRATSSPAAPVPSRAPAAACPRGRARRGRAQRLPARRWRCSCCWSCATRCWPGWSRCVGSGHAWCTPASSW
jgi:hypothetical protein